MTKFQQWKTRIRVLRKLSKERLLKGSYFVQYFTPFPSLLPPVILTGEYECDVPVGILHCAITLRMNAQNSKKRS